MPIKIVALTCWMTLCTLSVFSQTWDDVIDKRESPIRFSDAVQWALRYTDVHGRYTVGEKAGQAIFYCVLMNRIMTMRLTTWKTVSLVTLPTVSCI